MINFQQGPSSPYSNMERPHDIISIHDNRQVKSSYMNHRKRAPLPSKTSAKDLMINAQIQRQPEKKRNLGRKQFASSTPRSSQGDGKSIYTAYVAGKQTTLEAESNFKYKSQYNQPLGISSFKSRRGTASQKKLSLAQQLMANKDKMLEISRQQQNNFIDPYQDHHNIKSSRSSINSLRDNSLPPPSSAQHGMRSRKFSAIKRTMQKPPPTADQVAPRVQR